MSEFGNNVYFSESYFPFSNNPDFGSTTSHVVVIISLIELEMLRVAVSQHGKTAISSIQTIFKTLKSDKQKSEYIKLFSKKTDTPYVQSTIAWAYNFAKPVYDLRNKFSHHIWGQCHLLPNSLILSDPIEQLTPHAAISQIISHYKDIEEANMLTQILSENSGAIISPEGRDRIFEIVVNRQNSTPVIEARKILSDFNSDTYFGTKEIWIHNDFKNAVIAANIAREQILKRLHQVFQCLNGMRSYSDLDPFPK